ncbi:LOW QUALITY PROTEIN: F-box only protein 39 [Pluvialis apricaria]
MGQPLRSLASSEPSRLPVDEPLTAGDGFTPENTPRVKCPEGSSFHPGVAVICYHTGIAQRDARLRFTRTPRHRQPAPSAPATADRPRGPPGQFALPAGVPRSRCRQRQPRTAAACLTETALHRESRGGAGRAPPTPVFLPPGTAEATRAKGDAETGSGLSHGRGTRAATGPLWRRYSPGPGPGSGRRQQEPARAAAAFERRPAHYGSPDWRRRRGPPPLGVCLRRVFHWSDDRDRSRAALVCKKWNRVMHSALWRSRTITFCGRPSWEDTLELQSALWYVKKFAKYLECLELKLWTPYNTAFTQKFQVALRGLLSHLVKCNSRLVSLSVEYLALDCLIWKNVLRAQFLKNLATFLKRMSKRLDYLNLKRARVILEEGCELLNSLSCLTNKSFVSEINIEDFFGLRLPVYSSTLSHQTMSKFHSLVVLTFNYNCISDKLLNTLWEHSAHSPCTLNIKCHIHDPHGQVVWGMLWANWVKRAPKLNVNFARVMKHDHLARILLVEIPVRSICLQSCSFSDPDRMRPTNLLPVYWCVLQKLTLELNNDHELLDDELLQHILSCKGLLFLKGWAFLSVTFVERLLQNRAERKCIVTTIKVRLCASKLPFPSSLQYPGKGEVPMTVERSLTELLT